MLDVPAVGSPNLVESTDAISSLELNYVDPNLLNNPSDVISLVDNSATPLSALPVLRIGPAYDDLDEYLVVIGLWDRGFDDADLRPLTQFQSCRSRDRGII